MDKRRTLEPLSRGWMVASVAAVGVFGLVAVEFAIQQSVWTDEATQLSGLTLGFSDQLRWLAGHLPHEFAVPLDRTPPFSYWLGSIWISVFGNSVPTLRFLSIFLSVASLVALSITGRRYLGGRPTFVCLVLLAFSPNFIVEAAEIRAYAAFIFFSILLIHCYLRLLASKPDPSTSDLWSFALAATMCSYTHFFGILISTGAFLSVLSSYFPLRSSVAGLRLARRAALPILFSLIAIATLVPFAFAAVGISGADAAAPATLAVRIHDLIRLIYRFYSHQSMLGFPGLTVAALLAGAALTAFALTPGSDRCAKQLLLFLVVNLALTVVIGLFTRSFNAFTPSYSVWVLPVNALLFAASLGHANRYIRGASVVCIAVLVLADGYGATHLARAGEIYGHTRSTVLKTAIDKGGAAHSVVLYINDAPAIYFAMDYYYGDRLRQYVADGSTVRSVGSADQGALMNLCKLHARTLVIARYEQLSADDLQFFSNHPDAHTEAIKALYRFTEAHRSALTAGWTLISQNEYLSQSALALAIYHSRKSDVAADSNRCTGGRPND